MSFGGKEYASISKQFLTINKRRELLRKSLGIVLTQISAEKCFKRFGDQAVSAMIKELNQLDDGPMPGKRAIAPVNHSFNMNTAADDVIPDEENDSKLTSSLLEEKIVFHDHASTFSPHDHTDDESSCFGINSEVTSPTKRSSVQQ